MSPTLLTVEQIVLGDFLREITVLVLINTVLDFLKAYTRCTRFNQAK